MLVTRSHQTAQKDAGLPTARTIEIVMNRDRGRVWCRLLYEMVAFCAGLGGAVAPAQNLVEPVFQAPSVTSPFPSEDLAEEAGLTWVNLTTASAAVTGGTQTIRPIGVASDSNVGLPIVRQTPPPT